MQIFDSKKKRIGTLTDYKELKIVKTLSSGDKELSFKYPAQGEKNEILKEENYIRTKTDEYVIRSKKTGQQYNEYVAQLNVEDLEGQVFPYGFESKEQTIIACLEFAFEGTGWRVGNCAIKKKRTINNDEETTAWNVLQDCLSTYRCECKINTLEKTVDLYEQIGKDRGCYFIENLNLRKLTITSDTYDFYTRIIPIGKDDITIDWLGKGYIDNNQYSDKVKTCVWRDERYTNTTSLIEDATAKLDEMSKPYESCEADVIDFAKINEEYEILDYDIGDTVYIVSKKNRYKKKNRIVKMTEYPDEPQKNTIEISNISKTFAQVQEETVQQAKAESVDAAVTKTKKILQDGYYTKEEVESHITASAEQISLGLSKTYATTTTVTEKYNEAVKAGQDAAAAAEANANKATDEKLTEYSTTEEMKSAIEMSAEQINLGVRKTYATTTTVTEKYNAALKAGQDAAAAAEENAKKATDEKLTGYATTTTVTEKYNEAVKAGQDAAAAAEANANKATDEKLTEYSTTEEMKSAIEMSAEEINLEVSKKVNDDEFATKLTQNSQSIAIAWNGISQNVQFESGELWIYAGEKNVENRRLELNWNGIHLWRTGSYLGVIGSNAFTENEDAKGLVIDLDTKGSFWSLSAKRAEGGMYYSKWCYSRGGDDNIYKTEGLHAGCDVDLHHNLLKNVAWDDTGAITGTMQFVNVKNVSGAGYVTEYNKNCYLKFVNGILIDAEW